MRNSITALKYSSFSYSDISNATLFKFNTSFNYGTLTEIMWKNKCIHIRETRREKRMSKRPDG